MGGRKYKASIYKARLAATAQRANPKVSFARCLAVVAHDASIAHLLRERVVWLGFADGSMLWIEDGGRRFAIERGNWIREGSGIVPRPTDDQRIETARKVLAWVTEPRQGTLL